MGWLLGTDLIGSVIVILGAAWGGVKAVRALARWISRLGDNTAATEKLTVVVSEIRDDIKAVMGKIAQHDARLGEHEQRITIIERKGSP